MLPINENLLKNPREFSINPKFLDKIGEIAKTKNISKSDLIRKMIATYVQGSLKG